MKISPLALITLSVLSTTSLFSYAEETQVTNSNQYQPTVELLVGQSKLSTGWMAKKDHSYGVRGSIKFNQYFGAELAYQDFGKISENISQTSGREYTLGLSMKGLSTGVKGIYSFGNNMSLVGRSGLTYLATSYKRKYDYNDIDIDADNNSVGLYYGLGLMYAIQQFTVGIEYTHYDVSPFEIVDQDIHYNIDNTLDNTTLSFGMKF